MRGFERLSEAFFQAHPKEAARHLEMLSDEKALEAFLWLETESRAHCLENLSLERASALIDEMPEDAAVETLKEASSGACAAILQRVDRSKRESLFEALPPSAAEPIRDLLEQSQFTLAPLMQTKALTISPDSSIGHALDLIKKSVVKNQTTLFVLNENKQLVGTLHLKDLLAGGKKDKLADCMNPSPMKVLASSPRESLLEFVKTREVIDLPVVDENNVFRGFIPFAVWLEEVKSQLAEFERTNQTGDTLIALGEAMWVGASAILETLAAFSKANTESIRKKETDPWRPQPKHS